MVSSFPGRRAEDTRAGVEGASWPLRHGLDGEHPWGLILKTRALYKEHVLKIATIFVAEVLSNSL